MGHLALHVRSSAATVEPGNCPREPFSLPPEGAQSKGGGIRGGRGALAPQKGVLFLTKSVIFNLKHGPSLLRKRTDFFNILSLNVFFFLHFGAQLLYREGTE